MSGWFDIDDPPLWIDKVECNGRCLTGADVGVPEYQDIAYAHPDCLMHGWKPNGLNSYQMPAFPTDGDER